jgi:hypothetical protein
VSFDMEQLLESLRQARKPRRRLHTVSFLDYAPFVCVLPELHHLENIAKKQHWRHCRYCNSMPNYGINASKDSTPDMSYVLGCGWGGYINGAYLRTLTRDMSDVTTPTRSVTPKMITGEVLPE